MMLFWSGFLLSMYLGDFKLPYKNAKMVLESGCSISLSSKIGKSHQEDGYGFWAAVSLHLARLSALFTGLKTFNFQLVVGKQY
jgi:hypothetical protein